MKIKTSLTTILLFIGCSIFSQYYPLISEGKTFYNYYYFESSENEEVEILGDTIVNDTTYKIVDIDFDSGEGHAYPIAEILANEGSLLLREDIESKSVYRRINGYEELYYDFSMDVGDTIAIQIPLDNEYYFRTWQLDSIKNLTNDQITRYNVVGDRMVYYLSEKNDKDEHILWIEGIGNLRGIWGNDYSYLLSELVCVDSLGNKLFSNSEVVQEIECKGPVLLSADLQEQNSFEIYPNPTNGKLIIESIGVDNLKGIKLYNLNGQLIISEKCNGGNSFELNIEELNYGFYILEIANEKNSLRRIKILKKN